MTTEPLITGTAKIWLREDGIIQMVTFPNTWQRLEDAQANVAAGHQAGLERRRPLLVDIRATQGIDREARAYYSRAQDTTALALLVESPVTRVMANFFISLNQPTVPIRLFTVEAEAVAWLKGFI